MRRFVGSSGKRLRRSAARRLLAMVFGLMLGLSVALPVFAADGGTQPQIVGGRPVDNGGYPFVASLGDVRYGATAHGRFFCGGSLIDRNSVLTAAHCVQGRSSDFCGSSSHGRC